MRIFKKILLLFFLISSFSINVVSQDSNQGKLKINVNLPEPFYLVIDKNLNEAQKVDSGQVVSLSAGLHIITLVSKFIDDHSFQIQIDSDTLNLYSNTFTVFRIDHKSTFKQIENQENLVIVTDPESDIYLNGELIGKQYSSVLVNPGTYKIKTDHPTAGSLEQKIKVDLAETEQFSRFNIPQHSYSSAIHLFPGAGYILNGQDDKAITTYLSLALLTGSYFTLERKKSRQAPIWNVKNMESLQTASLIGIGAVYLFSIIDGKRKPKNGYPGKASAFELSNLVLSKNLVPSASFKVNF